MYMQLVAKSLIILNIHSYQNWWMNKKDEVN